jgi:hypothetical protein
MKKRRYLMVLGLLFIGMITQKSVEAAQTATVDPPVDPPHHLTFDLVCDGSVVCRIQNASLDNFNGSIFWIYQPLPETSGSLFAGWVSLELQDGSSHGFLRYELGGGYFVLGINDAGSLVNFTAYGTVAPTVQGSMTGTIILHCEGNYS